MSLSFNGISPKLEKFGGSEFVLQRVENQVMSERRLIRPLDFEGPLWRNFKISAAKQ